LATLGQTDAVLGGTLELHMLDDPHPWRWRVSPNSSARLPASLVQLTVPTFGWPAASPAPGWATYEQPRLGVASGATSIAPFLSGKGELL
jgi:hypothetical protein